MKNRVDTPQHIASDQHALIELAMRHQVLSFGDFTLKSGRKSRYFFNLGRLAHPSGVAALAQMFCRSIRDASLAFDVLFGPAYKGIPLATATSLAWFQLYGEDIPFAYSRKEAKKHGESGDMVGDITGKRVIVVDDVLTAGTAAREALERLRNAGAIPVGLFVALDRAEAGQGDQLARDEIAEQYGIPVHALLPSRLLLDFHGENTQ